MLLVSVLSPWRVLYVEPIRTKHSLDMPHEGRSILLGPQVEIESVNLVYVLLLVVHIVAGQVPCLLLVHNRCIDQKADQGRLQVVISDVGNMEVAIESVLLWSASMVRNFELGLVIIGIIVEVYVAPFGKALVRWSRGRMAEVIVTVCEAAPKQSVHAICVAAIIKADLTASKVIVLLVPQAW